MTKEIEKALGQKETDLPISTRIRRELRKKEWKPVMVALIISIVLIIAGIITSGNNLTIFAAFFFFASTLPVATYFYFKHKRIGGIEEQFPNFLRDIAEFKRSGMPLNSAIQSATRNDYGELTPEIKRMALELSWGVSFQKTLQKFSERVDSHLVERAISIIMVAQASGGEVTDVLETVSSDLRKLKEIEKERKSKLSVYTLTIYSIYLLLLLIIIMLMGSFVPSVPKIQAAGDFMGGSKETITEFEFRTLLFHVSIIEAFFAGLISGDMGEGSVTSGVKHSIILVLITVLAFQLVPPSPALVKIADSIVTVPPTEGISTEGFESMTYLTEDIDAKQVAEQVREIAKEKNYRMHKSVNSTQIIFRALTGSCTPCDEGKIMVMPNKILVAEGAAVKFKVRFTGQHFEVQFSDV